MSQSWDTWLDGHQCIVKASSWHGNFREMETPPIIGPDTLYKIMPLSMNIVAVQVQFFFFKNCIPGIHTINSHLERKYVNEKDTVSILLWYWKQGKSEENTWEALYMGSVLSAQRKCGLISPDPHIMPFLRKWLQNMGSNPYLPVVNSDCKGTFQESH